MAVNPPFNIVNAELELLAASKEQGFPVVFKDWDRIHDLVEKLPGPERVAGHLAWVAVESAVASILALIPWTAAYSQLDQRAHFDFAWVTPTLIVLGSFSIIVAGLSFWYDHNAKEELTRTAKHICEDMDAIAARYRPAREEAT